MLRARKPEVVTKRLKLFMFGPAGLLAFAAMAAIHKRITA